HRLDLVAVVLLGEGVVLGPVDARAERRGVAVDLRGQQVPDAAGWGVEDVISRVLVGPGGAQAGRPRVLEDRVHLQVAVRVDGLAGLRVDRQLGRVDQRLRVGCQLEDGTGQSWQALAGVERV